MDRVVGFEPLISSRVYSFHIKSENAAVNVHPHTNESVLRISTDAGQTFGPVINLGANGTRTTGGNNTTAPIPERIRIATTATE
jgi:hypothetical protein